MENSDVYILSIARKNSQKPIVSATVQVFNGSAVVTEIHAETAEGHVLPSPLASVDLSLLVRTMALVSRPESVDSSPGTDASESETRNSGGKSPLAELHSSAPSIDGSTDAASENRTAKDAIPSDFGVNYWRLGSLAKVAKHYDVPHHVAQSWIKKLQRDGKVASQWPKAGMRRLR